MQTYHTDQAPEAIGPYSQAISSDGWLFTSGQVGIDVRTGELVEGGFENQAVQVLANLNKVLSNAGCSFSDVVKATVYVTNMDNFPILNELYGKAMGPHRPARSTVEVSGLPKNALVEIDLVARIP